MRAIGFAWGGLLAAVGTASWAAPTAVQYQVDQKSWQKNVTSSTSLTFELFSDSACTASVHSEMKNAGDASIQVLKLSALRVKGGDKPAKPARSRPSSTRPR
jgi:hypothetical protein